MGMLHESSTYPAFPTGEGNWSLAGEVWAAPSELRDFETQYGKGDFYVIPILPKGAARAEENVVSLWVKTGPRLASLSKAVRAAGAGDVEAGGLLGARFNGQTRPGKLGPIKVWDFEYRPPARQAQAGSLLGDAAASDEEESGSLLGD